MDKLIQCPFCNGMPEIVLSSGKVPAYRIYHACKGPNFKSEGADIFIKTKWFSKKEEAIKAWNRRGVQ